VSPADATTRARLLDAAEEMAQTRGYNAFSFRDLAVEVGIRAPSIHHHFATKADLGRLLMARYRERFAALLAGIEARTADPRRRIRRFVDLFRATLARGDRLCLCGMLATEYATLPASVRDEVRLFFGESEAWLARVIEEGRRTGVFARRGSAAKVASTLFAALEGAMISARTFGDASRLEDAGEWLIAALGPATGRAGGTRGSHTDTQRRRKA
jgi:TetR/AcrR family transcriptional regulator, transcriptional repressor for nem operon